MRRKLTTIAILVLAAVTSGYVVYRRARTPAAPAYRTAPIQLGNVQASVTATGTLGAVTTVQVGTQVSGQIAAIYVDFNSKVKKGQLIARIDPTLQQQAVADAQTGVARADATLDQTKAEFDRTKILHDQGVVTDPEFNTAQLNYQVAKANSTSAQIALDKARQNLAYTSIYAPIDGVVVERDIDVGQTVASSLQSPQLFVIANDLSQMQILATVDESDIGRIRDGQPVTFTVQAFPGRTFTGSVRQVRINATTVNNVVNYTAVVSVQNPDGQLLPGMTATVRFLVASADSVLTVPNAALRFTPAAAAAQGHATKTDSTATLWRIGQAGALSPLPVHTGLTDGSRTQVSAAGLAAGTQVVIGASLGTPASAGASANLLQPQSASRRGPPGPF